MANEQQHSDIQLSVVRVPPFITPADFGLTDADIERAERERAEALALLGDEARAQFEQAECEAERRLLGLD